MQNILKRVTLLLLAGTVSSANARDFIQNGAAMYPTIKDQQVVKVGLLSSLTYQPQRWDVVAFKNPNTKRHNLLVMRIIGLPNETLRLAHQGIYINDRLLPLPAQLKQAGIYYLPAGEVVRNGQYKKQHRLDEDEYFLMGDNTRNAADSRFFGPVKRSAIINKIELKSR